MSRGDDQRRSQLGDLVLQPGRSRAQVDPAEVQTNPVARSFEWAKSNSSGRRDDAHHPGSPPAMLPGTRGGWRRFKHESTRTRDRDSSNVSPGVHDQRFNVLAILTPRSGHSFNVSARISNSRFIGSPTWTSDQISMRLRVRDNPHDEASSKELRRR